MAEAEPPKSIFSSGYQWVSGLASSLWNKMEGPDALKTTSEVFDAAFSNHFLEGMGAEDKKLSFSSVLPYATLATLGFMIAAGGPPLLFTALFFTLSFPAAGLLNVANEYRKHKGIELPDPSRLLSKGMSESLTSAWDACVGNNRLTERGLDKLSFDEAMPYARAVAIGASVALLTGGVGTAVLGSLAVFAAASVVGGQIYSSFESYRHDHKKPSDGTGTPTPP